MSRDPIEKRLTPKQKKAARLMAQGQKVSEVAREVGVSRRTIWNWQQLPGFQRRLRKFLDDLDHYVERKEKVALSVAWDTVLKMMTSTAPVSRTVAQSRATAVQLVLGTLNRRDRLRTKQSGSGRPAEENGRVVNTEKLKPDAKNRLKELLVLTREIEDGRHNID